MSNESDAETITVLAATYLVEYQTSGQWTTVGSTCSADPSPVFVFGSSETVNFSCSLSSPLPQGSTVRVTAASDIGNRDKNFLDRHSKAF